MQTADVQIFVIFFCFVVMELLAIFYCLCGRLVSHTFCAKYEIPVNQNALLL